MSEAPCSRFTLKVPEPSLPEPSTGAATVGASLVPTTSMLITRVSKAPYWSATLAVNVSVLCSPCARACVAVKPLLSAYCQVPDCPMLSVP